MAGGGRVLAFSVLAGDVAALVEGWFLLGRSGTGGRVDALSGFLACRNETGVRERSRRDNEAE